MEIIKTENGSETTFKLVGCLDTAATPKFAEAIASAAGASAMLFDCSELEFIASSALRLLVSTKKSRGADTRIALMHLNEVVREVFDATGLDEVFEVS